MFKKLGLTNILFLTVALLLVGGVLASFWVRSNLEIIDGTTSAPDDPKPRPLETKDCVVTGCSGEICAVEHVVTTCEYKEVYACYKSAACERQSDGECGWTVTDVLKRCLGS